MRVHGTNFEISDCDLYGTECVIETQNGWNNSHANYDMTAEKSTAWTMVHGAWRHEAHAAMAHAHVPGSMDHGMGHGGWIMDPD